RDDPCAGGVCRRHGQRVNCRRYDGCVFRKAAFATFLFPLLFISCSEKPKVEESSKPVGAPIAIQSPLGLPPVPIPADNPPTADGIALGRRLYYEPQLSADNTIACANCHSPTNGFTDGKPVSTGVGGKTGTRNAPTTLNAAF